MVTTVQALIGLHLTHARKARRMPKAALARALCLTAPAGWARREAAQVPLTVGELYLACEVLDISPTPIYEQAARDVANLLAYGVSTILSRRGNPPPDEVVLTGKDLENVLDAATLHGTYTNAGITPPERIPVEGTR
jgi:hypothetical protein